MSLFESVFIPIIIAVGGTILGVYLQAKYELIHSRKIRKEEHDETKKMMVTSLLNEVEYNKTLLEADFKNTVYGVQYFDTLLKRNAFNSVTSSGRYHMLNNETQRILDDYYEEVDKLNILINKLDGEERSEEIRNIFDKQHVIINTLKGITNKLITQLQTE